MVDDIVDNSRPRGRVEIRTGVGRRRRWTEEQKGRIVAESYRAGAIVSEVARRYEISPQHLFAWRKAARAGLLTHRPRANDEMPKDPYIREKYTSERTAARRQLDRLPCPLKFTPFSL